MNAPWRIELFGGLQLLGENHTVSRFQTRKTGALLGYLAYHKEKPISREVLADLFWPENEPEAARNSLRVALNSLRRQLEPPGIPTGGVLTADRAFVWLSGQAVVTDTFEFDRALKAERLGRRETTKRRKSIIFCRPWNFIKARFCWAGTRNGLTASKIGLPRCMRGRCAV